MVSRYALWFRMYTFWVSRCQFDAVVKAYQHDPAWSFLFESKPYKCSQPSKQFPYFSSLILYKYYEVLLLTLTASNVENINKPFLPIVSPCCCESLRSKVSHARKRFLIGRRHSESFSSNNTTL